MFQALSIAEIGVKRLDGADTGGFCRDQRERANQLVSENKFAVRLAVGNRSQRRGKVFRAPGQGGKARRWIAIVRQSQDGARCFRGDGNELDAALGPAACAFNGRQIGVERLQDLRAVWLGHNDARRRGGADRFEIRLVIGATDRIDAQPDRLAVFFVQEFLHQGARLNAVPRRHRNFQIEDQRIGGYAARLGQLLLAVGNKRSRRRIMWVSSTSTRCACSSPRCHPSG